MLTHSSYNSVNSYGPQTYKETTLLYNTVKWNNFVVPKFCNFASNYKDKYAVVFFYFHCLLYPQRL